MQIFKFLAALLAIATLGVVGCGEKEAANSGSTEGQYASPDTMAGESGDMADPGEEAPAEEAPAEEAPAEEAPAEEAPAEEAPAEEAPAEEAPAEEAPAEEEAAE